MLRVGLVQSNVVLFEGGIVKIFSDLMKLALHWHIYIAVIGYGFAFLLWMRLVVVGPVSVVYPAVSALAFIMVTAADYIVFGSALTVTKIVGLAVIIVGIGVVSLEV